jgi:site-specific recombinase XerD
MYNLAMLRLYRWHSPACKQKLKATYKKLKPPAQRRAIREYITCNCPIWLTGSTDTETYPRQATGLRDWVAAEALKRSREAGAKDTKVHGPRLADCVQTFLDAHTEHVGVRALGQYKVVLDRLQEFAHSRNKHFIRELDVDLLERFKTHALASLKSTSKAGAVQKLKKFLSIAYKREWTLEALALKVESTKAVYEQKTPYNEEEISTLMEAAAKLNGGTTGYAKNGRTFRLLLEFMLETGTRVSDAVRFDPGKCTKSELGWAYKFQPKKQRKEGLKKTITAYLSKELKTAIDKCEWFSPPLPFAYRPPEDGELEQACYERMQEIGKRCDIADCRPHRLRHSFAVRKLTKGIALDDVSKMLGHASTRITQDYYNFWDPGRDLRLERIAHESRPKS